MREEYYPLIDLEKLDSPWDEIKKILEQKDIDKLVRLVLAEVNQKYYLQDEKGIENLGTSEYARRKQILSLMEPLVNEQLVFKISSGSYGFRKSKQHRIPEKVRKSLNNYFTKPTEDIVTKKAMLCLYQIKSWKEGTIGKNNSDKEAEVEKRIKKTEKGIPSYPEDNITECGTLATADSLIAICRVFQKRLDNTNNKQRIIKEFKDNGFNNMLYDMLEYLMEKTDDGEVGVKPERNLPQTDECITDSTADTLLALLSFISLSKSYPDLFEGKDDSNDFQRKIEDYVHGLVKWLIQEQDDKTFLWPTRKRQPLSSEMLKKIRIFPSILSIMALQFYSSIYYNRKEDFVTDCNDAVVNGISGLCCGESEEGNSWGFEVQDDTGKITTTALACSLNRFPQEKTIKILDWLNEKFLEWYEVEKDKIAFYSASYLPLPATLSGYIGCYKILQDVNYYKEGVLSDPYFQAGLNLLLNKITPSHPYLKEGEIEDRGQGQSASATAIAALALVETYEVLAKKMGD